VDDEEVALQFVADTEAAAADIEELAATAQEVADAAREAQDGLGGMRDNAAEAAAGAQELAAANGEAALSADEMRDRLAEVAAAAGIYTDEMGRLRDAQGKYFAQSALMDLALSGTRDEALEAAAAMKELAVSEEEAGASAATAGAEMDLGFLGEMPLMVLGILALVAAAAAVAPAILAAGAGIGAFALFAVPTIMQVTGALGDTKAQLDKLPLGIRLVVTEFKNVEAEWKSLSAQFAVPVENLMSQALGDVSDLLPKLVPLAQTGMKAMQGLMDAIGKGIDSKGFTDFLSMLNKLAGPALNALGGLAGTIGGILVNAMEQLAPYAVPMIKMLQELLKAAGPALINGLKFIAQAVIDMGKAITPVLGPLGKVFGYLDDHPVFAQIVVGILGIVAAFKAWALIMAIFDAVADANPFVLIGLALIALAILIATHTHQISEAFDAVRHAVAELGHDVAAWFDRIRHDIAAAVDAVINWLKGNWPLIVGILTGPVGLAVAEIVQHWNTIKKDATQAVDNVINFIRNNWKNILGWLVAPMLMAAGEIYQHWHDIANAFDEGRHDVAAILAALRHDIAAAWDDIRHDAAAAVDAVIHDTESNFDAFRHGIAAIVDAIPGDIEKAWDTIRHDAAALGDDVLHQLEAAWNSVYSATSKAVTDVLGFFEKLPGQVISFLAGLPGEMVTMGVNVVEGMIRGVESMAGTLENAILNLIPSPIRSVVSAALGILSPSTVFHGYGVNLVQGLINGVKAMAPALQATMRGLAGGVTATGSSLAGGAIAPAIVGGGGVTHTVNVNVNGQGVATSGLMSPQYQQDLQRAVQEVTLQHAQLNPSNGLNPMWGR
jgi:phage-related protein